jgi:hypothetical protein
LHRVLREVRDSGLRDPGEALLDRSQSDARLLRGRDPGGPVEGARRRHVPHDLLPGESARRVIRAVDRF